MGLDTVKNFNKNSKLEAKLTQPLESKIMTDLNLYQALSKLVFQCVKREVASFTSLFGLDTVL